MSTGLQKLKQYINALELKKVRLDRATTQEQAELYPNTEKLATLEKNRGLIQEQINQLQGRIDTALNNRTNASPNT
jgi:chromosome segregation ATPase